MQFEGRPSKTHYILCAGASFKAYNYLRLFSDPDDVSVLKKDHPRTSHFFFQTRALRADINPVLIR